MKNYSKYLLSILFCFFTLSVMAQDPVSSQYLIVAKTAARIAAKIAMASSAFTINAKTVAKIASEIFLSQTVVKIVRRTLFLPTIVKTAMGSHVSQGIAKIVTVGSTASLTLPLPMFISMCWNRKRRSIGWTCLPSKQTAIIAFGAVLLLNPISYTLETAIQISQPPAASAWDLAVLLKSAFV